MLLRTFTKKDIFTSLAVPSVPEDSSKVWSVEDLVKTLLTMKCQFCLSVVTLPLSHLLLRIPTPVFWTMSPPGTLRGGGWGIVRTSSWHDAELSCCVELGRGRERLAQQRRLYRVILNFPLCIVTLTALETLVFSVNMKINLNVLLQNWVN